MLTGLQAAQQLCQQLMAAYLVLAERALLGLAQVDGWEMPREMMVFTVLVVLAASVKVPHQLNMVAVVLPELSL